MHSPLVQVGLQTLQLQLSVNGQVSCRCMSAPSRRLAPERAHSLSQLDSQPGTSSSSTSAPARLLSRISPTVKALFAGAVVVGLLLLAWSASWPACQVMIVPCWHALHVLVLAEQTQRPQHSNLNNVVTCGDGTFTSGRGLGSPCRIFAGWTLDALPAQVSSSATSPAAIHNTYCGSGRE